MAKEQKSRAKRDDEEQSRRFIEAARKIGADDSDDAFERVFGKLMSKQAATPKQRPPKKK